MRKICIVISARPSYSRIKGVMGYLKADPDVELQVVLIGSALLKRYGIVEAQIINDGFEISERVFCIFEGDSKRVMAHSTGAALNQLASTFDRLKPDIVLTIADRYETIATSIAASYSGITLAHTQGGELTGSIDERVRHANTKLADIHFPANVNAARRIIDMGESPSSVHMFGCPSIDIAKDINYGTKLDFQPEKKYRGVGPKINTNKNYCVAMFHSDTNSIHETAKHTEVLLSVLDAYEHKLQTYWFWPNIDAGSEALSKVLRRYREKNPQKRLHFIQNMSPEDFLKLCYHSTFVIGNSSVGIRECSFLGVSAINLGHRQRNRDRWESINDCDIEFDEISKAVDLALIRNGKKYTSNLLYGDGQASKKIASKLSTVPLTNEKYFYERKER